MKWTHGKILAEYCNTITSWDILSCKNLRSWSWLFSKYYHRNKNQRQWILIKYFCFVCLAQRKHTNIINTLSQTFTKQCHLNTHKMMRFQKKVMHSRSILQPPKVTMTYQILNQLIPDLIAGHHSHNIDKKSKICQEMWFKSNLTWTHGQDSRWRSAEGDQNIPGT